MATGEHEFSAKGAPLAADGGTATRDLVFISYSHADEPPWLGRLRILLKPYIRQGRLSDWCDPYIKVGEQWRREIKGALEHARVGVFLVSPNFLASDFIAEEEVPPLMQAAAAGDVTIVAVPIRWVDINVTPFQDYQWARDPKRPLDQLKPAKRNAALVEIVKVIAAIAAPAETAKEEVLRAPAARTAVVERGVGAESGELHDVPAQRPNFVPRPAELARLKATLLGAGGCVTGVTGSRPGDSGASVGLHGMGGIGKTELAVALVHDDSIRSAFADGIFWLTLGQTPDVLGLQGRLWRGTAQSEPPFADTGAGHQALREHFASRQALIVLDDLWRAGDAAALAVSGERGRVLTTTRDASLLTALGAAEVSLDVLDEELALLVLANWSGQARGTLPPAAKAVAKACGYLPLALALAGAQVHDSMAWADVLSAIRAGDLEFLDHPYGSVFKCLRSSVEALPEDEAKRYGELAVALEDVPLPVKVVCALWRQTAGLARYQSHTLLQRLADKALLALTGAGAASFVSFHDLQHDFLRLNAERPETPHGALLDAYRQAIGAEASEFPAAWARLPWGEGYMWRHLADHLLVSGQADELKRLLLDYRWMAAKLAAAGVDALLADYDRLPNHDGLRLVRQALLLSKHVVARDRAQLAGQLTGRLRGCRQPALKALVEAIRRDAPKPWLAPSTPSLTAPGGPLINTLAGHSGVVSAVTILPDGCRALSCSADGTLNLWDLARGTFLRTVQGNLDWPCAVAALPDGRRAISGSHDSTVRLWDLESGVCLRTFVGHSDVVGAVAVLADGHRAISGSQDKTLKVWDLDTGDCLRTLKGHTGTIRAIEVLPYGKRVISASSDKTLRLWDLETGCCLRTFEGHPGSADGHSDSVEAVAVLSEGRHVLSGSRDATLKVWDLLTGACLNTLKGHSIAILCVAALPDGRRALSGSLDNTLKLWDLATGSCISTLKGHSSLVNAVAVTPDGRRALSGSWDKTLKVWDLNAVSTRQLLERHSGWVSSIAVLPDGRRVISRSSKELQVWDVRTGKCLDSHVREPSLDSAFSVALDCRLALSGSYGGSIRVWDLVSDTEASTAEMPPRTILGVTEQPDGRRVVFGYQDNTFKVWDLAPDACLHVLEGHSTTVSTIAIAPNGRRAFSGSVDTTLRVWDLESGSCLRAWKGHFVSVYAVALLPDGRRALSGSGDGTLRLWDIETSTCLATLTGHNDMVKAVAVLPDGLRAISGSHDMTVKLWDLTSGDCLATFTGEAPIECVACADAHHIVAGAIDGTMQFLSLID